MVHALPRTIPATGDSMKTYVYDVTLMDEATGADMEFDFYLELQDDDEVPDEISQELCDAILGGVSVIARFVTVMDENDE